MTVPYEKCEWPFLHEIGGCCNNSPCTMTADIAKAEAKLSPPMAPVLNDIEREVLMAEGKHDTFNSAHEGYAVILEEMDELKAHVWTNQKRRDMAAMRAEAVQVAAMAVRFIRDICDGRRGGK